MEAGRHEDERADVAGSEDRPGERVPARARVARRRDRAVPGLPRRAPLTHQAGSFVESQLALAKKFGERGKVTTPNLASLMFHVRDGNRTLLLTGDGHADDVLKGLAQRNLLDANGKLHVDVLKVPHHGAEFNMSVPFAQAVTADHYIAIVLPARMFKNGDRRTHPVEQLRRVHGGDARRGHGALRPLHRVLLAEPAGHRCLRVPRHTNGHTCRWGTSSL